MQETAIIVDMLCLKPLLQSQALSVRSHARAAPKPGTCRSVAQVPVDEIEKCFARLAAPDVFGMQDGPDIVFGGLAQRHVFAGEIFHRANRGFAGMVGAAHGEDFVGSLDGTRFFGDGQARTLLHDG